MIIRAADNLSLMRCSASGTRPIAGAFGLIAVDIVFNPVNCEIVRATHLCLVSHLSSDHVT